MLNPGCSCHLDRFRSLGLGFAATVGIQNFVLAAYILPSKYKTLREATISQVASSKGQSGQFLGAVWYLHVAGQCWGCMKCYTWFMFRSSCDKAERRNSKVSSDLDIFVHSKRFCYTDFGGSRQRLSLCVST